MPDFRIACPRGCGETFAVQPINATILHECKHTMHGVPYKNGERAEIEVVVSGPNAGQEAGRIHATRP